MNRRRAYDAANWTLTDVELARQLHVTKQAVALARKVRGIAPAAGHGGRRRGAGVKPKPKPSPPL